LDIGADENVKQEGVYCTGAQTVLFNSPQRRKGRKEDNPLVAANFIEYFLCVLCAFAVNKN
jgi:hypothetical protein